ASGGSSADDQKVDGFVWSKSGLFHEWVTARITLAYRMLPPSGASAEGLHHVGRDGRFRDSVVRFKLPSYQKGERDVQSQVEAHEAESNQPASCRSAR